MIRNYSVAVNVCVPRPHTPSPRISQLGKTIACAASYNNPTLKTFICLCHYCYDLLDGRTPTLEDSPPFPVVNNTLEVCRMPLLLMFCMLVQCSG